MVFTQALKERADYFQTKGLRHILRIKAAYYSKVSNREVLDQSSRILYGEHGKVKPINKIISDRAITLLGHIIRTDVTDHMRKIAIDAEYKRVERAKKRVGRPRFYWLQETMKRAYRLIRKKSGKRKKRFNIHSEKKRERVAKAANERAFPFDKRNKRNTLNRKGKNKSRNHDDTNQHQHSKAMLNNNQNNSGENKRKREEGSNQGVEPNTSTREQKEAQRRFRNIKQNLQTSFQ